MSPGTDKGREGGGKRRKKSRMRKTKEKGQGEEEESTHKTMNVFCEQYILVILSSSI
jgi:hypothetical protein